MEDVRGQFLASLEASWKNQDFSYLFNDVNGAWTLKPIGVRLHVTKYALFLEGILFRDRCLKLPCDIEELKILVNSAVIEAFDMLPYYKQVLFVANYCSKRKRKIHGKFVASIFYIKPGDTPSLHYRFNGFPNVSEITMTLPEKVVSNLTLEKIQNWRAELNKDFDYASLDNTYKVTLGDLEFVPENITATSKFSRSVFDLNGEEAILYAYKDWHGNYDKESILATDGKGRLLSISVRDLLYRILNTLEG